MLNGPLIRLCGCLVFWLPGTDDRRVQTLVGATASGVQSSMTGRTDSGGETPAGPAANEVCCRTIRVEIKDRSLESPWFSKPARSQVATTACSPGQRVAGGRIRPNVRPGSTSFGTTPTLPEGRPARVSRVPRRNSTESSRSRPEESCNLYRSTTTLGELTLQRGNRSCSTRVARMVMWSSDSSSAVGPGLAQPWSPRRRKKHVCLSCAGGRAEAGQNGRRMVW